MNLHFDHVGDVARVNSAKLILEKIKELNPKNLPLTLTGDFNLTDDSEPIKNYFEVFG
jgi:endonuclease/exonuclease/phosphatase family metal-dependent hydrolase